MNKFVQEHWPGAGEMDFEALAVDGSDRRFWRVRRGEESRIIIDHPDGRRAASGLSSENDAYHFIARHLDARGLPVPRVLAHDRRNGRLLVTDLGDRLLMAAARERSDDPEALIELYLPVIQLLVDLQLRAKDGFDPTWCHDTTRFTAAFFREREADYFVEAFGWNYLGLNADNPRLPTELDRLAVVAAGGPAECLVHRDFQSRNILLTESGPAMVDFQSARLGPPAYDLAAVVLDPYVDLDWEIRDVLLAIYFDLTHGPIWPDEAAFRESFWVVALHRTMQTLGAFGFLTRVKGRAHFAENVPAGVGNLVWLLGRPEGDDSPALRELVGRIQEATPA
ncbi:MAG: phosphotransferase [Proteobacteria bacterium]|nr:phosphotransferase [Pseudomonadota bacterium]